MMKKIVTLLLFFIILTVVSQQKVLKELTLTASDKLIEIETFGLDDVVIENSKDNTLQVLLIDENVMPLSVEIKKINKTIQLSFKKIVGVFQKEIFRKYITKRLERARVIVKVPVRRKINVYGRTIGIVSKSYKGDLSIFIDKGNVRLHRIVGDLNLHLFQGNVYGEVFGSTLNLKTNKGTIKLNDKKVNSPFFNKNENTSKSCTINSINANINLLQL